MQVPLTLQCECMIVTLSSLCAFDSTVADIRQTCCEVLVQAHRERICGDAEAFLVNNQTDDLHRLFMLFSELPTEHALISFKVSA